MRKRSIICLCMLAVALTPTVEGLDLSSARPIAILRGKGGGPVAYGTRYLKKHLEKAAGRPVIVVQRGEPPANAILVHIGRTDFVQKHYGDRLDKLPRAESYVIETKGDQIILAGKGGQGSQNAAIEFLRIYCGVEQYIPGETGTVYTLKAPIVLGEVSVTHTPPFFHRLMYTPARNSREHERLYEWLTFNHRVTQVRFHHNLWRLLKQTEHAQAHPEFFSYVNGIRRIFKKNVNSAWQPCMTDEDGIKVVANEIMKAFDKQPDLLSVSIAVNDGGNYCECETCKPLWLDGEDKFGICGKLYYTYANRLAEIVSKKYPDRILGCLGYSSAGVPPDGMKAHPMVMPFVTIAAERATTDALWAEHIKHPIDQVAKNTHQFGVYEYIHGGGMFVPFIFDKRIEQTIKYAYSKGCRAAYLETGQQNWGLDVYKYALVLRLLWNPDLDVKVWKDRFFTSFYGASAPAMREYFDISERAWGRVEHVPVLHRKEEQMSLFTEGMVTECADALGAALKQAPNDLVAQRVLMSKRAFSASAALIRRYWAGVRAQKTTTEKGTTVDALRILAAVAGPDNDYELLFNNGPVNDLYMTIQSPGEASVRMQATYTEARTKLFRRVLDDVLRQVRERPKLRPRDVALREVQRLFSSVPASPGRNALMFDALNVGSCIARVKRVKNAPVLDGKLEDEAWQKADVLGDYSAYGKGGMAKYRTEARIIQADKKLLFGFDCRQSDALWAAAGLRDGRVWTDDSIEILINRPGETNPDNYMQFIVNVEGTIFDRKKGDTRWNGPIEVKASATKGGWQLEAALPLSAVREYIVAGSLHVNLVRNKQKTRVVRGVRRLEDYDEISSWFPSFKGNANLLSRGWLLFD